MSTIAQGGVEIEAGRRGGPRWSGMVLAALLVAGWVVQAVASWLGGYQTVSLATLQEELSSGQVTSYVVVDGAYQLTTGEQPWWTARTPAPGDRAETDEFAVVYTAEEGRARVAVPSLGRYGPPLTTSSGPTEEESRWLQTELLTSDVPARFVPGPAHQVAAWGAGLLALGALVHIVLGPRPRRGTRWFWFWMLGLPGGVGALAYAVLEVAGWRSETAPADELRATGVFGFFMMIIWGTLLSFAAAYLLHLVGASVIPL